MALNICSVRCLVTLMIWKTTTGLMNNQSSCLSMEPSWYMDVASERCASQSTIKQKILAEHLKEQIKLTGHVEQNNKTDLNSPMGMIAKDMSSKSKRDVDFNDYQPPPTITLCYRKKKSMISIFTNSYQMCQENVYTVTFDPDFYYPSTHLHVTCYTGDSSSPDYNCLSGGGICIKKVLYKTIKYNHLGVKDINQWADIVIPFTVACSCNVRSGCSFGVFVGKN